MIEVPVWLLSFSLLIVGVSCLSLAEMMGGNTGGYSGGKEKPTIDPPKYPGGGVRNK